MNWEEEARLFKKFLIGLGVVWVATLGVLGVKYHQLTEARQTVDRQERQLKELYGQLNELTLQYVGIVKRLQKHGGRE
jgi:hypothetical protein